MVLGILALSKGPLMSMHLIEPNHCCFPPYCRYSVENTFFDEKEDACAALGEVSVNTR